MTIGALREDKAKGLADYFEHMESVGRRQRIMDAAVEEMRKFSTSAEIAKTLRFAVEVLEGETVRARGFGPAFCVRSRRCSRMITQSVESTTSN
jgi:hypothetical protein